MKINNINELKQHLDKIGCQFDRLHGLEADQMNSFWRTDGNRVIPSNTDLWLFFTCYNDPGVLIGGDYWGDPMECESKDFKYPFDSDDVDGFIVALENMDRR